MRQVYTLLLVIMMSQLISNFAVSGMVMSNTGRGFLLASSSLVGFCLGSMVGKVFC